jgi:uncharacterized paraquat-inducible protein A
VDDLLVTAALTLAVIFQLAVFGPLAGWIGKTKGKAGVGFALGALFGLLGIIIMWAMKPTEEFKMKQEEQAKTLRGYVRTCPHCAEEIKQEAKKCKHCGSELTA